MISSKTYGLLIHGEEIAAKESFPVYAPETGEIIAYAPRAASADVNLAVESAQKGIAEWANIAPEKRELALLRAADLVEANESSLLDLLIDESASTISKARFEIRYTANLLRTAAGEARRLYGDTFPNDKPHRMSMVIREPLGIVAAISPFNAPLVLLAKMIVFALAAGNAVIAKPSEETPLIALEFGKLLQQVLPKGVFNVLTGYGHEVGAALVKHPQIRGIAFTGSTSTGIRIQQDTAPMMKRLQLELGGKNPLIVLNDANIQEAAAIAAVGAFYHGGQICMSNSRIIIEAGIAESFTEALVKKAESLYLGDLRDEKTAYGALINQKALEKAHAHVQTAVQAGAKLLTGGKIHHGLCYAPTILQDVPRDNLAWCEETFAPVVYLTVAKNLDEAIALANDTPFGLSAGILTNDLQCGMNAARQIKAGAVHVGSHAFQSDALAPVGGYGLSGIGRSGGKYSIEHFTELKWISLELGNTPRPF